MRLFDQAGVLDEQSLDGLQSPAPGRPGRVVLGGPGQRLVGRLQIVLVTLPRPAQAHRPRGEAPGRDPVRVGEQVGQLRDVDKGRVGVGFGGGHRRVRAGERRFQRPPQRRRAQDQRDHNPAQPARSGGWRGGPAAEAVRP
ncbi:hypothetical protein [Kitasatospora sp. NPDC059800]|uniref:hypothetical protein n=1 Tax=Kitasatospora sp. NPDC059800 TaxID=3346951 RepID=UPI00365FB7B0